jgi:hypothetical protein
VNSNFRRQLKKKKKKKRFTEHWSHCHSRLEAAAEMVASCQPHCPRLGFPPELTTEPTGNCRRFFVVSLPAVLVQGSIVDKTTGSNLHARRTGRPLNSLLQTAQPCLVVALPEMNAFVAESRETYKQQTNFSNCGGFSSAFPPDPLSPVHTHFVPSDSRASERTTAAALNRCGHIMVLHPREAGFDR